MKAYKYSDSPLEVHGLPFYEQNHLLERIPAEYREKLPSLEFLGRRCPGMRVCFRTNSTKFTIKLSLETLSPDIGMSIFACQSVNVLIGKRSDARFAGLVFPPDYNTKTAEKTFYKSSEMEDITLFLPRNEIIADFEVLVEDNAIVEAPTPYRYPAMLFYGSSITEGGCCNRITNAYNAIISNHLDVDYYNYGFSGNAKGEPEMADLINTITMSIFVLDYDHNAPSIEHLAKTHEPFFKRIREKNPTLPIIIMTKPDFDYSSENVQRRDIIRATYEHALADGDNNVYFIDGQSFFGDTDRHLCTCDCCHPNDLGFYRMAQCVEPVVKNILEKQYPNL
ncbi:MAG: hypothetical protein HFE63_08175 [Clostridiales bacterium]|nr:hypothetical protein [Clostridiales bacterium]